MYLKLNLLCILLFISLTNTQITVNDTSGKICETCLLSCDSNEGENLDENTSVLVCQGRPGQNGSMGPKGQQGKLGRRGLNQCGCDEYHSLWTEVGFLRKELTIFQEHAKLDFYKWKKARNGMWYRLFEDSVTWHQARLNCLAENARLPSSGMRKKSVRKEVLGGLPYSVGSLWLGFNDIDEEGRWMWSDGVEFFNFHWRAAEPNNVGGIEDCAHMIILSHTEGRITLNDLPCNRNFYVSRYMCEYAP